MIRISNSSCRSRFFQDFCRISKSGTYRSLGFLVSLGLRLMSSDHSRSSRVDSDYGLLFVAVQGLYDDSDLHMKCLNSMGLFSDDECLDAVHFLANGHDHESASKAVVGRDKELFSDQQLTKDQIELLSLEFPCSSGSWMFTVDQVVGLAKAYQDIEIHIEILKAHSWILANRSRRKTKGGMMRFINGWLSRSKGNQSKTLAEKQNDIARRVWDGRKRVS